MALVEKTIHAFIGDDDLMAAGGHAVENATHGAAFAPLGLTHHNVGRTSKVSTNTVTFARFKLDIPANAQITKLQFGMYSWLAPILNGNGVVRMGILNRDGLWDNDLGFVLANYATQSVFPFPTPLHGAKPIPGILWGDSFFAQIGMNSDWAANKWMYAGNGYPSNAAGVNVIISHLQEWINSDQYDPDDSTKSLLGIVYDGVLYRAALEQRVYIRGGQAEFGPDLNAFAPFLKFEYITPDPPIDFPPHRAIDLVNRVRGRMRFGPVGSITDANSKVILDVLNNAVCDVLASKDWDFDIRHDGVLVTKAPEIITDFSVTNGSTSATSALELATNKEDWLWNFNARIDFNDVSYPGIGFRIIKMEDEPGDVGVVITLEAEFPGSTASGVTAKIWAREYTLPDYVREVISISDEAGELALEQVDSPPNKNVLRKSERLSNPVKAGVYGHIIATYDESGADEPMQCITIWPTPDDEYVLHYSYYTNHDRLVVDDDTLEGVPDEIVEDIVALSHAKSLQVLDGYTDAVGLITYRDKIEREKFGRADEARTKPVESMRSAGRPHKPRSGGFPGRTMQ